MCDIFKTKEARKVLANKHIAVIGGSNMRGLYKDIVWLLNDNSFIPKEVLGDKAERKFPNLDGPRWKGKKVSDKVRKKFENNQDTLLKDMGTYVIHAFYSYKNRLIRNNGLNFGPLETQTVQTFFS